MKRRGRVHKCRTQPRDPVQHAPEKPLKSSHDIAGREAISLAYLEQLFVKLRRGKIVSSVRGPGGGYVLARPAADIRVDEIIDSVEESLVPVSCMDAKGRCICDDQCISHRVWQGLGERVRQFLSSITLADLVRDIGQVKKREE